MRAARPISVHAVFRAANLSPNGPVCWGERVPEYGTGVYVIVADDVPVYIGRTGQPLQKRLRQFYRHKYGASSPHRGGQAMLLLKCPLLVYWAPTGDYAATEHVMIEWFRSQAGKLPLGNRIRSARPG
jgi:hypothetical protein